MRITLTFFSLFFFLFSCKDDPAPVLDLGSLQLVGVRVGTYALNLTMPSVNTDAPVDQPIVGAFSAALEIVMPANAIQLLKNNIPLPFSLSYLDNNKTFSLLPLEPLVNNQPYTVSISNKLKGSKGETFPGFSIDFITIKGSIQITAIKFGGNLVSGSSRIVNIPQYLNIEIDFSKPLDPLTVSAQNIIVSRNAQSLPLELTLSSSNQKLIITSSQKMDHLSRYKLTLSELITGTGGESFQDFIKYFYTALDPIPKFPLITDDNLLTLVQQQTFKYFYDYAEPNSGMARERNGSNELVTTGGSGFGLMALVVAMERNFITRQQGVDRLDKIVTFLETADRFHGVWPHWINGNTGKVIPFGTKDNGGDLVETSFLVQGLLTIRQYLDPTVTIENVLRSRITALWEGVEWDWYRKSNENVLYWHWSPNYNWDMNFPLYGYFEEQITYFLAAASPTHSIPKIVYANGYGKNGGIVKNNQYEGLVLPLESPAPLFWVQYSYLGLDPHFSDDYANYWTQNVNATLINQKYCIRNPKKFVSYSDESWGLTASDNQSGYNAHSPANDLGVITPTAALSSFPYTPVESMKALKFFYYTLGDRLWGQYGFYDAFNVTENWTASSYLAIDQGPIIVMIENYRTGLLWNLFMSSPEVQPAMTKLNFVK